MRRMYSEKQVKELAQAELFENLPKPQASDNGKVLGVNASGEYKLITPPSVTLENIEDADGHKRFVEGNGVAIATTGLSNTYCRWSLSGSHLMCVFAGTYADETELTIYNPLARFELPQWIMDKIFPVFQAYIETRTLMLYGEDYTTQDMAIGIYKDSQYNNIVINNLSGLTLNNSRSFRIEIDLLIDNE